MLRELNPEAHIITTPVEVLGGKKVLDTMEGAIINLAQVEEEEHHHHHHDTPSAAAAMTTMRSMSTIITIMMTSAAAVTITRSTSTIITTMMTNVAADIIMIITIITQTKFSQAGVRRL